jgi:hypothetical protein
MKISYVTAALAASCLAGLAIGGAPAQAAGYGQSYGPACAPSYHADRQGNCQPNVAEANRYCPPGEVFNPFPDGWFCEAPSGGRTYYN